MQRFLSNVVGKIEASPTVSLNDKATQLRAQGRKILAFGGGEPDFDTPAKVTEEAIKLLRAGDTHYASSQGQMIARKSIANKLKNRNGIDADPSQIIVTPGAKFALYLAITALLNPGDEMMIFEPAWVSYRQIANLTGATTVAVPLSADNNYLVTKEAVEKYITPRTKLILINNPCNPTGRVWTKEELDVIADAAVEHDLLILSDEIYERLIYDGEHISIGSFERVKDRVITVNGYSKSHAMTGWRLGYVMANDVLIKAMLKLNQQVLSCVNSFCQDAIIAADDCEEDLARFLAEYRRRRDYIADAFNSLEGFTCVAPQGTFYLMPQITIPGKDGWAMTDELLDKCDILVAPGAIFGECASNHIRLSYATAMETIEEAVERMKKIY